METGTLRLLRLLCLLLALLTFGTALTACDGGAEGEPTAAATEAQTDAPPAVVDVSDAAAGFVVVRPDEASETIVEAAKKLRDRMKTEFSLPTVDLKSDFVAPNIPGFAEAECEVLVGLCDRDACRGYFDTLRYRDYVIALTGTKLVILGGSDEATNNAVNYFLKNLMGSGGKYTEGEIYRFAAEYPVTSLTLNGNDIAKYRIVYPDAQKSKYLAAADVINARLQALTGKALPVASAGEGENEFEIQLGDCKRAPSAGKTAESATSFILSADGKRIAVTALGGAPATYSVEAVMNTYFPANAKGTLAVEIPTGESVMAPAIGTPLAEGATMRIMSNNILGSSSIDTRAPYLPRIYMAVFPDIIGLQECSSDCYVKVVNPLSDYYGVVCRTIGSSGSTCYTPILYRKDLYEVVESGSFLYDQRWKKTDTKTLAWAVFRTIRTGEQFAVLNTHAAIITGSYDTEKEYGRKYTDGVEGAQWREDNSRQILEKFAELKAKYGETLPVFVMGDMNAAATKQSIRMLVNDTGLYNCINRASISHTDGASFHDVGAAPSATGSAIDHIFVTDRVSVFTHVINRNQDAYNSSDHCQVWVDVTIK